MMKRKRTFWRKSSYVYSFIFCLLVSILFTPNLSFAKGGTLADLSVNEGSLSPAFDPGINEYVLDVANSVTTLEVTALLTDPAEQQLRIQGEAQGNGLPKILDLDVGENPLSIEIEVYDPETDTGNTYTLTINRALDDPQNVDLWKLKVSAGVITPFFEPGTSTTEYILQVEHVIKSVEITAAPASSTAVMSIQEGEGQTGTQTVAVELEPGENNIPITVTSADESVSREYNLKIFRGPSSNADLKELIVSTGPELSDRLDLTPAFDSRRVTYSVTAPDIDQINLEASTTDPAATLTINGEAVSSGDMRSIMLEQGSNLIPIIVTAPDETTQKAYIVSINGAVSNNDLASLSINAIDQNNPDVPEALDLGFETTKTDYQLAVNNTVERLIINASSADPHALIMFNGTILSNEADQELELAVGENLLQLMVIAQDASTKTYTFEIICRAAVTIETKKLPIGLIWFPYHTILTAQGGEDPYTWASLNLPAGLSLDPTTGEITGSPENTGIYEVSFSVMDALGNTTTKNLSLRINISDGNGGYIVTALDHAAYTIGRAANGFPTMTVKRKISGMIPFTIKVTRVHEHEGQEVIVFVQYRNDAQIGINAVKADFDLASNAQSSFDVREGDLIKVYLVDDLQRDSLISPNVL